MGMLEILANSQNSANENFLNSVERATGAWGGLMDNLTYKAAGNELIALMQTKPVDQEIEPMDIIKVAQKYRLPQEKMMNLLQMMETSGALRAAQQQRRLAAKEAAAKESLVDETGLPSEVAGKILETGAKPKGFQAVGITEKGNLAVGYDTATNTYVVNENGVLRPYDPAKDGQILSKNLSQGVVVKLEQERKLAGEIGQDALDLAATQYLVTGQMPALGMGNANLRMKVLNTAGEIAKKMGVNPMEVPALQAGFKAEAQSYKTLRNATANFSAFEQGMIKNADYALSLSEKYPRGQLPPINAVRNYFRTKTGDPEIVRFSNALYAAALEYEKIRTAGTNVSSAELSVGAQKKAEELINTAQTHDQLKAAVDAMKVDAKNIMDARRRELSILQSDMKNWGISVDDDDDIEWD